MRSLRCRGCGSGPSTKRIRLLIVGRKRLPKADEHERFWGFVDDVTHSADTLERRLRESEYKTRTRRRRHAPAVRPAGEGVYAIALLDYPERLQEEFRGRRFEREDVKMLDYPGAEFILVGTREDPERAYHLELPAEEQDHAHPDIVRELRMAKSRHPVKPLFEGRWQ